MKIAYCIASTCRSGGMERVLAGKANWLAAHGHRVDIITTDQRGRKPFFALDPTIRCHDLGIDYEANNGGPLLKKLAQYPLKQWRHRRRLRRLLASLQPDVTVSMADNEAAILPSLAEGGRKVMEVHFSRFKRLQYGRRGLWGFIDRRRFRHDLLTARRYDRFVTLTEEDLGYWQGVDGAVAIPNASPYKSDTPADVTTSRKVLAVGRLTHQKGFERLIRAWAAVAPEHPGWKLEIVGSGPQLDMLLNMAADAGVASSVLFSGNCPDMAAKYRTAALLAMTSRYEGLPMALIEAQTFGLPAVAMDCKCGPRDVITDGSDGFVTPAGDTAAFASRLSQLMADDVLRARMAQNALAASARYRREAIMNRWLDLFNQLTDNK